MHQIKVQKCQLTKQEQVEDTYDKVGVRCDVNIPELVQQ